MRRRLWTVLVIALVGASLCGDAAVAGSAVRDDTVAGATVRALTSPVGVGAQPVTELPVPAGFGALMGYRPVRVGDGWGAPDGACSAPTGSTRYDFSAACRAHDLGYDLLRYAARVGAPLGPWAREAIDAAFGRALRARCAVLHGAVGCRVAAAAYHGVVVANSWRQGWQAPRPEPVLRWIGLAVALTLAPVVAEAIYAARARRSVLKQRNQ